VPSGKRSLRVGIVSSIIKVTNSAGVRRAGKMWKMMRTLSLKMQWDLLEQLNGPGVG